MVAPSGLWRMDDGRIADIYDNERSHNPINQVRANTLAAKNWIIGETAVDASCTGGRRVPAAWQHPTGEVGHR
ncbi:hypothetical protein ABIA39_007648 [Nocardia sp. GAS34]